MYRYLDARGMQKRVAYDNDLAEAIRLGHVHARTMLAEGENGPWVMAEKHPAYQRLAKLAGVPASKAAPSANRWRTRALLAVPVVVLLAVGLLQVRARQQRAELFAAYQGALLDVQAGRMPPAELLTETPPDGDELEILWIELRAAADVLAGADSAMAAHGITTFDPPATWLTPDYLRSARMYPDVGRHWASYVAFSAQYVARIPQLTRDGLHRYATQAGPSRYRASIMALDVDEKMEERMRPWQTRATIASAGHELHNAFTNSRERVVIGRNGALEVGDPELKMMVDAQINRIRTASRELDVFEQPLRPEQVAILDAPAATVRRGESSGPRTLAGYGSDAQSSGASDRPRETAAEVAARARRAERRVIQSEPGATNRQ